MYVHPNFKTKKDFIKAFKEGSPIEYFQPGLGETIQNGTFCVEGPHYPKPHTWYASCTVENGKIVKVKQNENLQV